MITDLDLHIIAEGENGFTFNPYKYTVDMRKLVGIILRNVMDKSNTDPNALTGKVCRLKTKRAYDWDPEVYGRNHAVYHWLVILGCTIAKKKYMKERKEVKKMEHFEFHWAGMPKKHSKYDFFAKWDT